MQCPLHIVFNPFTVNVSIYYHLEFSEKSEIFWKFQGVWNRNIEKKELKIIKFFVTWFGFIGIWNYLMEQKATGTQISSPNLFIYFFENLWSVKW